MSKRKLDSANYKPPQGRQHFELTGHYLVASVPRVLPTDTVAAVRTNLYQHTYENIELICVTESTGKLVGIVSISELFAAAPDAHIDDVMHKNLPFVHPDVDQERVASIALHHVHNAVAVVDDNHLLLGTVPSDALMHILRREHVEDLHRLAGIGRETDVAREALESPPLRRAACLCPMQICAIWCGARCVPELFLALYWVC